MLNRSDLTIIIPTLCKTKEQKFALNHCLMSLEETVPEIRKIVVKNGGTEPLEGYASKFQAIYLRQQGQCRAVNTGASITNLHTPWILITNDDMVYPPGWFENFVGGGVNAASINNKLLGLPYCFSPKLIEPRPGAPTFEVYFCGGAGGNFDKQKFLEFARNYQGQGLRDGFNLPFLMTRELWDTVGGYDINYDPWGSNSDSDLEYKIKLAGVQPMQNTDSIVYHFSQTSGTFEPKNQGAWQKNWQYFIDKWGFPRTDEGIWEANFEIPKPPIRKFTPDWEGKYASET